MRDLSKQTEEERGTHHVYLWHGTHKGYEIEIIPDNGEAFTELFTTISYSHARQLALRKHGPGHRIPIDSTRDGT